MEVVKKIAAHLKVFPKLRLGEKLPGGGVKPTGPHTVKFLEEPTTVLVVKEGKTIKHLKFIVEEKGAKYRWLVPIFDKEDQPHYLIERLTDIEVGDERVLEMKKRGARNYIEVLKPGAPVEEEPEEEEVEVEQ